jgi:hypothetical protein
MKMHIYTQVHGHGPGYSHPQGHGHENGHEHGNKHGHSNMRMLDIEFDKKFESISEIMLDFALFSPDIKVSDAESVQYHS